MVADPRIIKAVEQLDYRVTTGDVAAQAGLDVNLAQKGLLALAADVGGDLQVSETGQIAYLFPRNLQGILRQKFLRLRLQAIGQRVWGIVFYLVRISFGIFLIVSIALIFLAITLILVAAATSSQGGSERRRESGGGFGSQLVFIPDLSYFFYSDPYRTRPADQPRRAQTSPSMNFLEGVFSFLFGDGNPNADLEERRWQGVAAVIRQAKGAVAAEQIAPYLDVLPQESGVTEAYVLPVLVRFDGRPEVSPTGDIIYHFPELQTKAAQRSAPVPPAYLEELPWQFSRASTGQIMLAIGLGSVNLIGALVLKSLLGPGQVAAQMGGLVAFVQSIFWVLLAYGAGFLLIPLGRYYWIQWRNDQIRSRNYRRQQAAQVLQTRDRALEAKLAFAQKFAAETLVSSQDLAYTTEKDLIEQDIENADKIDAQWRRRLEDH